MENLNEYRNAILHIAKEVDSLVIDSKIMTCFNGHIEKMCKMVEDYGQAQQPYTEKLEETKKQIERDENTKRFVGVPLTVICPPPEGYVKMSYSDNYFIDVPMGTIYRPDEPVNPLLWFGIFGNAGIQRKPTEEEKLMCDYVLMAIIHDWEIQFSSRAQTIRRIFSAEYKGKLFERDKFCEKVWSYYHYNSSGTYSPQEKLSELNRALEHVKADIVKKTEKNAKKNIYAIIISLFIICIFELSVWYISIKPFNWLRNHQNTYSLQGSIIFLIPCLIFGFFNPKWRSWCWKTAVIPLIILIISLLGGRSSQ